MKRIKQIKPIKAVIFDMDGVLVNSEPHHVIIEQKLFASVNLKISKEEHRTYLGKSPEQMWDEVLRKHNIPYKSKELAEKNTEEILRYFSEITEIEPEAGIRELLDQLQEKGIPVAIASSSGIKTIDLILNITGLSKYFPHKASSETVGKSKPEPDVYLHAAKLLSVKPEECIVIEDSPNGIKAAKAAKMVCVAYTGSTGEDTDKNLADETIDHFNQLPTILNKYMAVKIV
jgi:beta-phosphoglucomutase